VENRKGIDQPALWSIIAAHTAVDMQTMSISTMLPLLLAQFDLTYATAAGIVTANALVIAIAQPFFGVMGDRKPVRWLALAGCLLCGAMMGLVTFLPTYWLVIAAVMLSGIGSALFHPEGLANARAVSGEQRATGVSWFFFGGNFGFGFAPFVVTALVGAFGIHGAAGLIVPTIIGGGLMATQMRKFNREVGVAQPANVDRAAHSRARRHTAVLVCFLLALIVLRSSTMEGMKVFMPLYLTEQAGSAGAVYWPYLSAISLSGILGTLVSGPMAERLGRRNVMMGAMVLVAGALFIFWRVDIFVVRVLALALFGAASTIPWTVTVTMIQDTMPNNVGLAGGLTLGTAYGAAGLGVTALGLLADSAGLSTTLTVIQMVPVLVFFLSAFVPQQQQQRALARQAG
jgi:FSR family fosmidomycin resistance protein-like MFS transporter